MDFDIATLRAFVAAAETGRMTQAAAIVHVTQSAVSQRIQRLEQQLDRPLFERRSTALVLTRDGEKFLPRARRLISANDEVLAEMRAADFHGTVRLGVAHDVVAQLLPPILRSFRHRHPQVLVTLVSDTSATLAALQARGEIDLAITTDRAAARARDRLATDTLVWVGARRGDAARRRPLSVALGREDCGFRASAVAALDAAGIAWRPVCQVGSLEPVFATLEADLAIAPFLSCTVPERLAILRDAGLPELPRFHLNLRRAARPGSAVVQALQDEIRAEFGGG